MIRTGTHGLAQAAPGLREAASLKPCSTHVGKNVPGTSRKLLNERLLSPAPLMCVIAWPHVHSAKKNGPLWGIHNPSRCASAHSCAGSSPPLTPRGCQVEGRLGEAFWAASCNGTGHGITETRTCRPSCQPMCSRHIWKVNCTQMQHYRKQKRLRPGEHRTSRTVVGSAGQGRVA